MLTTVRREWDEVKHRRRWGYIKGKFKWITSHKSNSKNEQGNLIHSHSQLSATILEKQPQKSSQKSNFRGAIAEKLEGRERRGIVHIYPRQNYL